MHLKPSTAQLQVFQSRPARRPVVLFYEYRCANAADAQRITAALAKLAREHQGDLRWAAEQQQVLIGRLLLYQYCCRLHFRSRSAALAHVMAERHAEELRGAEALQVAALSEQPRAIRLTTWLLSRVLPHVPFDSTVEPGPEPGMGSSIMPTEQALQSFIAHPEQHTPIVMVNWLRFRPQAQYADAPPTALSGQAAYYRYGKVAFTVLHSLRARAFFVSRYQQMLIGNGGEPGTGLWDDFVLAQYPSRATFKHMASLRRYRNALHHRQAGLAEDGQGLVLCVPCGHSAD